MLGVEYKGRVGTAFTKLKETIQHAYAFTAGEINNTLLLLLSWA